MAWDSSMTMGLTSQYMGMYSQQMGFSQQLSSFGPNNAGMQANSFMMGGMRGAGSIGNAAMTVGGIGAGLGATAAFGAVAGTGIGIPLAAAGMVGSYAGGQMMHGAEQQNMLNMGLRSSYGFRNNAGGQGFTMGQMGQIGGQLREMSHQFGPGGEITSFSELSTLATKMGQMNMSQGVRDVQTFTKKFKEMTDSLKTMAKDLGTSMEGAMEFANQAKQSGIFGFKNQAAFTSFARGTAVSGGLAMSEVTSAANIGSQISRSIGGLGRQGAMAGMRTIGQIGTAQQMGVLSEEDVYNATGLTGAEGRQAFAMSNMSRTAGFLKSGRGRRMLASMAGNDGSLDMGAVEQFMSGGMGVPETMKESQKHLSSVGRANFIRNEGRLRGAALEQFGGFGDAMQMMQWARSKGVDIGDMDDRSMLFAQRQLGMGRDEADQAIKMAQRMPAILAQQNADISADRVVQRAAQQRKNQGLEGVKNRFDQARETVNGHLEKLGQDVFNEGSEQIESFLNKLAGVYVQTQTADLAKLERGIRSGGRTAHDARRRAFGEGHLKGGPSALSMGGGMGSFDAFTRGTEGGFGATLAGDVRSGMGFGGTARFLMQGQSDLSRMKEAGYDLSYIGNMKSGARDGELGRALGRIEEQRAAALDPGNKFRGVGANNDWIDQAYAMDQVKGKGDERISSFGAMVEKSGSAQLKAQWSKANAADKARIMATAEREHGISGAQGLGANLGGPDIGLRGQLGGLNANSEGERAKIIGKALGTTEGPSTFQKGLGGALAAYIPGGFLFRDKITDMVSGDALARQKGQGRAMDSNEYKDFLADVYSGEAGTREDGRKRLQDKLKGMTAGDDKAAFQDLAKLSEYADWSAKNPTASPEEKERQARKMTGRSAAEAGSRINGGIALLDERSKVTLEESRKRNREVHGDVVKRMTSRGLIGEDGQLRALTDKEAKGLGGAGQEFLKQLVANEQQMSKSGDFASEDTINRMQGMMKGMSATELQKLGQMAAGTQEGAMALETASIRKKIDRGAARGKGGASMINDVLGSKLSKEDLKDVDFSNADSVARFAGKLGLGGNKDAIAALGDAGNLLTGPSSGKEKGAAAVALEKVKGLIDEQKMKDEKDKKDKAEEDTPTYKMMQKVEGHLKEMNGYSKNSATYLADISSKTKNQNEEKPSG